MKLLCDGLLGRLILGTSGGLALLHADTLGVQAVTTNLTCTQGRLRTSHSRGWWGYR